MNKQFSRYLDLLRVTAALLVLFAHAAYPVFSGKHVELPSEVGFSSVMVFFVLSGYVISYVAAEREFTLLDFSISRVSRVYSVVVPAIILTIVVDILFLNIRPLVNAPEFLADIPLYQYAKFPKYLMMDLTFGNQLWGRREPLFTNGTYWSMCLEVYYYALFAAAFYFRGLRRIIFLVVLLLLMGPLPLLRFHLWLFGCAAYWMHRRYQMSVATARLLLGITAILMAVDLATDLNLRIDDQLDLLTNGWVGRSFLRRFAGDTLTGLTITLNVFAAKYAAINFGRVGSWFTYLASFSFSLYLMHVPLLRFWSAYLHPDPIVTVVLVLASIWLLGQFTERQKDRIRNTLRRALARRPAHPSGANGARQAAPRSEAPQEAMPDRTPCLRPVGHPISSK